MQDAGSGKQMAPYLKEQLVAHCDHAQHLLVGIACGVEIFDVDGDRLLQELVLFQVSVRICDFPARNGACVSKL